MSRNDEGRHLPTTLTHISFTNPPEVQRLLEQMVPTETLQEAQTRFLPFLGHALSQVFNPDHVILNLERLASRVSDRLAFFNHLADHPRSIEILVTLFAGSQFLTEILFRNPSYVRPLVNHQALAQAASDLEIYAEAEQALASFSSLDAQLNALRRFQRWQLLRIGTSDLLGLQDLPTITAQLSHLADTVIQICLNLTAQHLAMRPTGFAVLGMGKLGGQELNYSSDIDLIFLAESSDGSYQKLGRRLIEALTRVTAEGFLYRVDMRLRPWGRRGMLVASLKSYLNYLHQDAHLWEKQALLKVRVVAGDQTLGIDLLKQAEPLIFAAAPDIVRVDVHTMKRRIEAKLSRKGRNWGEVKLGQGSIRDVEFVTQYLQMAYGDRHPEIRSRNTLDALTRLMASQLITLDEYRILADGYTFLRPVEHWLQMMHYRQTHTLPKNEAALSNLAQRLGFSGPQAGEQFLTQYTQHTQAIRTVYEQHLEAPPHVPSSPSTPSVSSLQVAAHVARLAPPYLDAFSEADIAHHTVLADQLRADHPVEVEAIPLPEGRWQMTIVGYDYLGELSLICGLLLVHGFSIVDGRVFTYRPLAPDSEAKPAPTPSTHHRQRRKPRRPQHRYPVKKATPGQKFVDVFTVVPIEGKVSAAFWSRYAADLRQYTLRLAAHERTAVQGDLAKRVAAVYRSLKADQDTLYPVTIHFDNKTVPHRTRLQIESTDTVGFLYELTNSLALMGLYVARMTVLTQGQQVYDTLYITDGARQKIIDPTKQRELRAAIVLIKHFTHLLPRSPNPESALLHFRQFLGQCIKQVNWPDTLLSLEQPEVLSALARLLGVSDFLWNDFLRMQHSNLFPVVRQVDALAEAKSKPQLRCDIAAALKSATNDQQRRLVLNAFKDREMFRIDMRDILGHLDYEAQFSNELSDLAEVVIETAAKLCYERLVTQFGHPILSERAEQRQASRDSLCPMTVCALGKCGGRELGYASDLELMMIYQGPGQTTGPNVISAAIFFEKLVSELIATIRAKREGNFEIDLQLRPYGKAGSLAVSLAAFKRYFAPDGSAWAYERQALVKLRPITGDAFLAASEPLSREIMALRDCYVYTGQAFDVAAMRGMRERQVRHLVSPGTINAKYSLGGLVDIEYLVQGLQIAHGHINPKLRVTNTQAALKALTEAGYLSPDDQAALREAYFFLRRLINALRIVAGHAKDLTVPPTNSEAFAFLARRLHYGDDLCRLQADILGYTSHVQEISRHLLG